MAFRKPRIHNNSGVPIFLIPYIDRIHAGSQKSFSVRFDLAEVIPAKGHIVVDCDRYSNIQTQPRAMIHIIFRHLHKYDGKDFLRFLKKEYASGVKPEAHETRLAHSTLRAQSDWFLDQLQVTGVTSNAGQTSNAVAADTQNEFLQSLREEVKRLRNDAEALHKKILALEERLRPVQDGPFGI